MSIFYAPNGTTKVRCESKRRYWVVLSYGQDNARIELRTNSIETARILVRKQVGTAIYDSARKVYTP